MWKGGASIDDIVRAGSKKVGGLSEDNLRFLLEMIDRFMQPDTETKKDAIISKRIGIVKGQRLYDDEYDFDEMNPEIAKMFGVPDAADC